MGRLLDLAAAALCVLAGLYIYSSTGSWLTIIGNGAAIFFVGQGIRSIRAAQMAEDSRDNLDRILELLEANVADDQVPAAEG